ncbi:MAG: hypothetical protein ACOC8O_02000 [Natronomonas sp.]
MKDESEYCKNYLALPRETDDHADPPHDEKQRAGSGEPARPTRDTFCGRGHRFATSGVYSSAGSVLFDERAKTSAACVVTVRAMFVTKINTPATTRAIPTAEICGHTSSPRNTNPVASGAGDLFGGGFGEGDREGDDPDGEGGDVDPGPFGAW